MPDLRWGQGVSRVNTVIVPSGLPVTQVPHWLALTQWQATAAEELNRSSGNTPPLPICTFVQSVLKQLQINYRVLGLRFQ